MNLADLIQTWGYAAVFAGTLLEGETVLVLAGFAAHRGYLDLAAVIGVAIAGSFLGDQLWFHLGRRYGQTVLERFPRLAPGVARMQALLARHHVLVILSLRFLYGLRTVGPLAIGMAGVPWLRFQALNLAGAIVWSIVIAAAGYLFGQAFELLLGDLRHYEEWLLAAIALAGLLAGWLHQRRRAATPPTQPREPPCHPSPDSKR